jgi:hypothetical protein
MKTTIKIIASLSFVMMPFGIVFGLANLHHWNDMQITGAMLLACIFSPLLMGFVMIASPNE